VIDLVDGSLVEGLQPVRQADFSHFTTHFEAQHIDMPVVDNL
jgi:hypothetical protein